MKIPTHRSLQLAGNLTGNASRQRIIKATNGLGFAGQQLGHKLGTAACSTGGRGGAW